MGLYRIWMKYYDHDGNIIGYGVHPVEYKRKGHAVKRAKELWGANSMVSWVVSDSNPFKGVIL